MQRAGVEGLLGLTRASPDLILDPCFPGHWPHLTASLGHGADRCDITILNPNKTGHGVAAATLNGAALPVVAGKLTLRRASAKGRLELRLI